MSAEQSKTESMSKTPWYKTVWNYAKHFTKTSWSLLYIVNGIAIGLYAFDFVHPPHIVAAAFGAISIAFAAVHLAILVNAGVKYETGNKRRK